MSKNKPHILIIPSWYPKHPKDIGGSFFREQAIALSKKGFKVGVIYPQIRSAKDIQGIFTKPYGSEIQNDLGLITYRWHSPNFFPKLTKLQQFIWISLGMKLFKRYIKENGLPDLIHVHSLLNGGLLAYEIYKKYNIPYIVTEHSTAYARNLINQSSIKKLSPIISNSCCCLAVSREFTLLLNTIFNVTKWTYLPNVVNNKFLQAQLKKQKDTAFTYINVCLLDKKKRLDLLLQAFYEVQKKIPSVHLKIGGDGPERQHLESLAEQLNIKDKISFLGMLSRDAVLNEMQQADAFVLSSEFETFGVVLIEALALGKPVIATKCGGPESIITPEVGYLVENGSLDGLTDAMLKLYDNRENFNSQKIRDYCQQNFSEEAVTEKLSHIYQQVLNEQS